VNATRRYRELFAPRASTMLWLRCFARIIN